MRIVLAFSGGLDTTFCVAWLRREKGAEVITVTVNTGGVDRNELDGIAARSRAAGAAAHHEIDARQSVWQNFASTLVRGNVLRGGIYPVSVAAERTQQAVEVAKIAREVGADAVAHGSTGAGNDQVRFDIALAVLLPDIPIMAPIRELALARETALEMLESWGLEAPQGADKYSVNRGLWGATLGGGWTHDPWHAPPADAWPDDDGSKCPAAADLLLSWQEGLPVALNGETMDGPELVTTLEDLVQPYRIGRGIHMGETVMGIKGRIGFVAGAALLLITAHRELEKLVLTHWQSFWKDHVAQFWGDRLHEGQAFDPVMRDIEALILSSQRRVEGDTRVRLEDGRFAVTGVRSPHSLMNPEAARYGEINSMWSGEEARAFAAVAGIPSRLAALSGEVPPW